MIRMPGYVFLQERTCKEGLVGPENPKEKGNAFKAGDRTGEYNHDRTRAERGAGNIPD